MNKRHFTNKNTSTHNDTDGRCISAASVREDGKPEKGERVEGGATNTSAARSNTSAQTDDAAHEQAKSCYGTIAHNTI